MRSRLAGIFGVLLGLFPLALLAASTPSTADRLVGLWGNVTVFGPSPGGPLTIDGRRQPWRAAMGGTDVAVEHAGGQVSFELPGDRGRFRGHLVDGRIEGFWIQPPGKSLSSAYATPMVLAAAQPQVWSGRVRPLPDQVSQYLMFMRTVEGQLVAYLRNPEFNLGRGRRYDVAVHDRAVVLTDPQRKGWALHGAFDPGSNRLDIDWQGIGTFAFTRRDRGHAAGYYASTPPAALDRYRVPVADDDGWPTASLRSVGMDEAPLERMIRAIEASDVPQPGGPQVHAVLVARHGKLVFEAYFHGYDRERTHDTRSAGKSFASLLVGMAIDHGARLSPDTPVLSMFPQYTPRQVDARKRAITVGELMDMTSGLACDDNDPDSPGNEDVMQGQHAESDWYRYTLDLPMARAPGGDKAVYCSAGINLLGGVVRHATGRWLPELFREWIAHPLQMHNYHINLMPDGDAYFAGGNQLRPRDLLKLGQLYLEGGEWNGRRLVDKAWVEASVTPHANFGSNHDYGYAWHLHTFRVGDRAYREYAAEGNGGQFAMVVPELDLAVVVNAGNYGEFGTWYPLQNLVTDYVMPAIADR